jgi:hypothetical protein
MRGSTARGLGPDDVQTIRDAVATGRRPKVVFTEAAGQIAGQVGQVVSLGDPAESEEWVVVRFGRDELPFSPADLRIAPKGPVKKAAAPVVEVPPARPEPEFVIDKPPVPSPRVSAAPPAEVAGAPGTRAPGTPASGPAAGTRPSGPAAGARTGVPSDAAASGPAVAAGAEEPARPARKPAGRPAKAKGPSGLTVTLAYAEGEWTVAAAQGAKALAKPYVIRPGEALKMVSLIDVPGVQEAVEQILAVERAEAEQQAQRLRAELAEIEARLAELRDAG